MNVVSLFSGVGGMDLGLEQAGHTIISMCEIDKNARNVLQRHWPQTPIYEDVTCLDGTQFRGTVDIVAGGSPCQNLSVAGKREGLGGTASSLFWHQCRIADQAESPWVIWENVAGALNSNSGVDFSAVLWGLTGFAPTVPKNGWRKMGMCVGPKRTAIWRLFDAQWFGVAQRRRRVFVVAGPRDLCQPEILFDCESVYRDTPSRHKEKQNTPPTVRSSVETDDRNPTWWDGSDITDTIDVSMASKGQMMPEKRRMFAVVTPFVKSKRAQTVDDNETWKPGDVAPTLNQFDTGDTRATVAVIASFDSTWSGAYPIYENAVLSPPVKVGSTLGIASPPAVATDMTVRRLTPVECERLMGYPDNWTEFGADGQQISDSQRYKMCGNGVVAPITRWIGHRLP
jgi:DNA (cytosine-5)-methyltransferase 1